MAVPLLCSQPRVRPGARRGPVSRWREKQGWFFIQWEKLTASAHPNETNETHRHVRLGPGIVPPVGLVLTVFVCSEGDNAGNVMAPTARVQLLLGGSCAAGSGRATRTIKCARALCRARRGSPSPAPVVLLRRKRAVHDGGRRPTIGGRTRSLAVLSLFAALLGECAAPEAGAGVGVGVA